MGVSVLGPLEVDGVDRELGRRDRVVLSALVVAAGHPVSSEQLADALWGTAPPASWPKVIQGCVVRLRKMLGSAAIESGDFGYRLALTEAELDCARFERGLERARDALAGDDPDRAAYLAGEALELWRGRALTDLEEWEPGRVRAGQLDGLRMDAEELLVRAQIAAGRGASVLEEARALVARAPFREGRWVLLATALHQSGRQAEALAAIQRARVMLGNELGLDPSRELVELELLLLRQDPSLAARPEREVSRTCPYQGLLAYDAKDADSFFGRDEEVAAALWRLRQTGVLAVVGPSGVGKSSLVRAGVVATLQSAGQRVLVTAPGMHPLDSLADLNPTGRQTLVVDQAEEVITMCTDPSERTAYFDALAGHVEAGGRLVLSLRADHLGDLAPYPRIARVLEEGLLLLGPMNEPELRRAIEGPALRVGLRLEPGLVDLLVRDVQGEPAALPLLSHVLRETWRHREGPTLTVAGYQTTGGVRHAVAQSAETLYEALDDTERARLRGLLLRLVAPTEDGNPARTRVPRDKLAADDKNAGLVEQLATARLLTLDGDSVEIAHEALFREWPRLRGWLDDDVDGQRLFRHLTGTADAWAAMGRPDSELYRGVRLTRALDWRDRATPDLDGTEQAFLDASLALNQTEERAATAQASYQRVVNKRLRGALGAVAALLGLALIAGVGALGSADRARSNERRAEASANLADARRAGAQSMATNDPATSLLLAVAALQVDDSAQARETLTAALMRNPALLTVRALGRVNSIAVSGDGGFVAIANPYNALKLFDARTLQPQRIPDPAPMALARFSPDSSLLATYRSPGAGDTFFAQPVRLYDMPSGRLADEQLGGWPRLANVEFALTFSDDGRRILAAMRTWDLAADDWSTSGVVSVWDLTDRDTPEFTVRVPGLTEAALSPDGRRAYTVASGPRPLRMYDVDSGRLVRWSSPPQLAGVDAEAADVSPDASTLAVAAPEEILRFDAQTLVPRGPALDGQQDGIMDLHYSADGALLLSASRDGTAIIWDSVSGAELRRFVPGPAGGGSWEAAISSDGRTLFTGTESLMKWDLTGTLGLYAATEASAAADAHLDFALAAPGGQTVARMRSGRLWFVDTDTGKSTVPVQAPARDWMDRPAWSRDGQWFLAGDGRDRLRVWNAQTGQLAASPPDEQEGWGVAALDADGDRIYAVEEGSEDVRTLDRATMAKLGAPANAGFGHPIGALLPDPASGTVWVHRGDGSLWRLEPDTPGKEASRVDVWVVPEGVPALSPDGTRMVGIDHESGMVRLLDLTTGAWLAPATKSAALDAVTFVYSPDGSQIASAGSDRIQLWDGRTGEYQASVPLPERTSAVSIAYRSDSTGLLVTALDGKTWTVPTRSGAWVDRACAIAGRNLTQAEWEQHFPSLPYQAQCPQ